MGGEGRGGGEMLIWGGEGRGGGEMLIGGRGEEEGRC